MASRKAPDLVLNATTSSIHMIVRQLFSRMVFSLQMECSLSMEIISFWLWLEGNGHHDFLASIESFDNHHLREIAFAGKMFIEALRRKSAAASHRSVKVVEEEEGYFQKEAMEGILFYLNNFCYKALEDILEIAEAKEQIYCVTSNQQVQHVQDMKGKAKAPMMSTKDLLSKIKASFTGTGTGTTSHEEGSSSKIKASHEEGSSSRSMPSPKNQVLRDIENPIDQCLSTYPLATLFDSLNLRDDPEPDPIQVQVQQQPSIPRDERTLFVTFSNGYPFTADELFEFFMGNFGGVEVICVEEPVEPRPPLYAHISFFTQETILHILRGNPRVKFVIRGKHLWARQFVPKRKKVRN